MLDQQDPHQHPPLDALIASAKSVDVVAHLAICPRCRVDARLARQALDADPASLPDIGRARERLSAARAEATLTFTSTLTESPGDGARWPDELRVGQRVEDYVVERFIARGGMGSVYRVLRGDEVLALKVVSSTSEAAARLLRREAEAQARLDHPNVVPMVDIVDVAGVPGLVMGYVPGPTLKGWLAARGRPPVDVADVLAEGIISGLEAAHGAGLVHRDLKPSNILLDPRDAGPPRPCIADFGLARSAKVDPARRLTRTGVVVGTPSYMSPEQIRDASRAGPRSDVFALGAVLYELVTARRAFPGADLLDVYGRIRDGRYDAPESIVEDLPERIVHAIRGALEPDAEARLPDCAAVRAVWRGGSPAA